LQKKKRLTLEEQENALMDKILELGAKKSDALFAEKKGMFELTQAEKNRIITDKKAIAQSLGLSEDKERELIQTALENEKNRLNDLKKAGISASAGNRDDLLGRALLIKKENPTISIEEAIKRAAVATYAGQAGVAEGKNDAATEKAVAAIRAKYAGTMKFLSPDSPLFKRQAAMMEKDIADARSAGGAGLPSAVTSAPTGKVKFVGYE
jgi:DNA gyrase/topoisomerase IV subunit A